MSHWLQEITSRPPNAWLNGGAIPVYSPRRDEDRAADPYDRDFLPADFYTAVALGHQPGVWDLADTRWGRGAAQGLYRTIASYVLELGCRAPQGLMLDAGCGVGRTVRDCAAPMPGWRFVASDFAYNMCSRAHQVLCERDAVPLASLARRGFLTATLPAREPLENATVAQASVLDLPFADAAFDCITATLLLDRVPDVPLALQQMARVLKPGGRLIISTPLNFRDATSWMAFGDRDTLFDQIRAIGLEASVAFDGLAYREIKDLRGSYEEWQVAVFVLARCGVPPKPI